MCRPCFLHHEPAIRELQLAPLTIEELRRKLWGQRFEKNRTPAIRARIAYAAHLLACAGDDEMLARVRETLETQSAPEAADPPTRDPPARPHDALHEEAKALSHLDEALDQTHADPHRQPGAYRTKDGHWVRSKSEREIANFLFDNRIPYQYERRVTIGDVDLHPDFYLPDAGEGVYLEHFGRLDDPRYHSYAERKAALFKGAGLVLVATDEKDALDFDSALQRKLGKYCPALNRR